MYSYPATDYHPAPRPLPRSLSFSVGAPKKFHSIADLTLTAACASALGVHRVASVGWEYATGHRRHYYVRLYALTPSPYGEAFQTRVYVLTHLRASGHPSPSRLADALAQSLAYFRVVLD